MASISLSLVDIIGVLIVYQGLLFTTNLILTKRKRFNFNIILAVLIFALALNFANMFILNQDWSRINLGPFFGVIYGPLCLIYARLLVYSDRTFTKADIIHFLPASLVLVILFLFPAMSDSVIYTTWFTVIVIGHIGVYLYKAYRQVTWFRRNLQNVTSAVMSANLSWLRYLIITVSILFVIVLLETVLVQSPFWNNLIVITIYLATLLFVNSLYWKSLQQPQVFGGFTSTTERLTEEIAEKYSQSNLKEEEASDYLSQLEDYMLNEKPYLTYNLTIEELAELTGIPARYLSQIINERLNKNFFDFVNGYRLEEAKSLLMDKSKGLRVNEVMYDSGFSSKSTFNAVFKKGTGMTPTEFRRSLP